MKAPLEVTRPARHRAGDATPSTCSRRTRELSAPVTIKPVPPKGRGDNLLLGEQAVASSTHGNMRLCGGVDGNTDSEQWGASGWHDATKGVFPDTYGVDFIAPTTVGRVVLQTLDSARYPAAVMGIRDFDVQVRAGGTWTTVGGVRGNVAGHVYCHVHPGRRATPCELVIHDSNDHGYSRIVELEAYGN